jgi:hypothetical protein
MINLIYTKIAAGILLVALGGGVTLVIWNDRSTPESTSTSPAVKISNVKNVQVHTASWYVAHRGILKQDELRCAGNAGTISQAGCQNAASADEQLTQIDMQNAVGEPYECYNKHSARK